MRRSLLPLVFLCAQSALAADNALTECRKIEDVEDRVACYDEFVDARYPAVSGAVPDAKSLFGTDDAKARQIVETSLAIEQIDRIAATVADVRDSADRKLLVALDNGQTWRQLDNKSLRLRSGDAVVVRKASLGSYLLEKASGSRSIRVKRVD